MSNYQALLACYRSGQIPEAAWQEHLRDAAFAAFVTDATAPAFGAAVAGGGAVFTSVLSTGAAWIVA